MNAELSNRSRLKEIEEVEIVKAELEAEHRRLFHEWCVAPNGSAEDDEAGLRYKAIRERWEAECGIRKDDTHPKGGRPAA